MRRRSEIALPCEYLAENRAARSQAEGVHSQDGALMVGGDDMQPEAFDER